MGVRDRQKERKTETIHSCRLCSRQLPVVGHRFVLSGVCM